MTRLQLGHKLGVIEPLIFQLMTLIEIINVRSWFQNFVSALVFFLGFYQRIERSDFFFFYHSFQMIQSFVFLQNCKRRCILHLHHTDIQCVWRLVYVISSLTTFMLMYYLNLSSLYFVTSVWLSLLRIRS